MLEIDVIRDAPWYIANGLSEGWTAPHILFTSEHCTITKNQMLGTVITI
jgi:hypothetical protein